jgi:hypothetical protein
MEEVQPTRSARRGRRRDRTRRTVLGVAAAVVVVVAPLPLLLVAQDDGSVRTDDPDRTAVSPLATVRAAIGRTAEAGSFEVDVVTITSSVRTGMPPLTNRIESHGIVNLDPYAMMTLTGPGSYEGSRTYVDSTHVWLNPQPEFRQRGTLLTDFAQMVLSALGPGPGAVAVLTLANRGGNLNLAEDAAAAAEPAGNGEVDGIDVTYYDVTIDLTRLADSAANSAVQQQAIADAVAILRSNGYEGTQQRIGLDAAGFIRESISSTTFADGSTTEHRMVLTNIGCAPRLTMPDEPAAPEEPTGGCIQPPSTAPTTTITAPVPTTTAPSATSTTGPTATTAASPTTSTTAPPPSTTAPPLTTPTAT